MSLYIVFDNLWSLMETSQSANLVDDIETAVSKSVNLTGVNVPEVTKVTVSVETDGKILLKVDNSPGEAASAIDYARGTAALISQTLVASPSKKEQTSLPSEEETSLPNIEVFTESVVVDEIFIPPPEKFEISFRYIIDQADIFRSRQETENSESVSKLAKGNMEKERAAQNCLAERRFQERQAENLKEYLKQKRFVTQLQK